MLCKKRVPIFGMRFFYGLVGMSDRGMVRRFCVWQEGNAFGVTLSGIPSRALGRGKCCRSRAFLCVLLE